MAEQKYYYDARGDRYKVAEDSEGKEFYYAEEPDGTMVYKGSVPRDQSNKAGIPDEGDSHTDQQGEEFITPTREREGMSDAERQARYQEQARLLENQRQQMAVDAEKAQNKDREQIEQHRNMLGFTDLGDTSPVTFTLNGQEFIDVNATTDKFRRQGLVSELDGKSQIKDDMHTVRALADKKEKRPRELEKDLQRIEADKRQDFLTKLKRVNHFLEDKLAEARESLRNKNIPDKDIDVLKLLEEASKLQDERNEKLIDGDQVLEMLRKESAMIDGIAEWALKDLPKFGLKSWDDFKSRWKMDGYKAKNDWIDYTYAASVVIAYSAILAYIENPDIVQIKKLPKTKLGDNLSLERKTSTSTRIDVNLTTLAKALMAPGKWFTSDATDKKMDKWLQETLMLFHIKGKVAFEFTDQGKIKTVAPEVETAYEFDLGKVKIKPFARVGKDLSISGTQPKSLSQFIDYYKSYQKLNDPQKQAAKPADELDTYTFGVSTSHKAFGDLTMREKVETPYTVTRPYDEKTKTHGEAQHAVKQVSAEISLDNQSAKKATDTTGKKAPEEKTKLIFKTKLGAKVRLSGKTSALSEVNSEVNLTLGPTNLNVKGSVDPNNLDKVKAQAAISAKLDKRLSATANYTYDQGAHSVNISSQYKNGRFSTNFNLGVGQENKETKFKTGIDAIWNINRFNYLKGSVNLDHNRATRKTNLQFQGAFTKALR